MAIHALAPSLVPNDAVGLHLYDAGGERIEHTTALNWKGPLNIDELPPRVSQTLRLDRFLLATPIRRQRISHLDRSAQLRAPRLQQFVNVFARVPPALSIDRDLSSSNLDY